MSTLLESLLTPQQRAQANAIDAAMLNLDSLRAERATLNTAGQAIDAALRPCFDADYGVPTLHPLDPRNDSTDDGFTSLQPLGDAMVLVSFSWDSNESVSIDGALIGGDFVGIDNFSNFVRGQWEKALRVEERKDAEISAWGE